jgi:hypothetical protein
MTKFKPLIDADGRKWGMWDMMVRCAKADLALIQIFSPWEKAFSVRSGGSKTSG